MFVAFHFAGSAVAREGREENRTLPFTVFAGSVDYSVFNWNKLLFERTERIHRARV